MIKDRFRVIVFLHKFTMFTSKPIYLIIDDESDKSIGFPFSSLKKATEVCQWVNSANAEFDDYQKSSNWISDDD